MSGMLSDTGTLYLIPTPLVPGALQTLPPQAIHVIHTTRYYIVENARSARRFIKSTNPPYAIEELQIEELAKHHADNPQQLLAPLGNGHDAGILSEAGCPSIADPGSSIVLRAHSLGIRVVPLTGPSSVLLALMASGMNGQRFHFHGYLSAKKNHLTKDLRKLEERAQKENATQIFIETPYRNQQVIDAMLNTLNSKTLLCIALDLTSESEFVSTQSIAEWRSSELPEMHKRPAVFCLWAAQ